MQQFLVLRVGLEGFLTCSLMNFDIASPGNAARLTESIAQIDSGEIVAKGLLEE